MELLKKLLYSVLLSWYVSCQHQLPERPGNPVTDIPSYSKHQVQCMVRRISAKYDTFESVDMVPSIEGDAVLLRDLQQCGYSRSYFSVFEIGDIVVLYEKLFGATREFENSTKLLYLLDDGEGAGALSDRFPNLAKEYAGKPQNWFLE